VGALVPVELGAANAPAPMVVAARLGISLTTVITAAELFLRKCRQQYFLKDYNITPAVVTDWWGDIIVIKEGSAAMVERFRKNDGDRQFMALYILHLFCCPRKIHEKPSFLELYH
jgi:DUF917 family protein